MLCFHHGIGLTCVAQEKTEEECYALVKALAKAASPAAVAFDATRAMNGSVKTMAASSANRSKLCP
jgi:hypothetical protein